MVDRKSIKRPRSASCDSAEERKGDEELNTSDGSIYAEINVHLDAKSSRPSTSKDAITTKFERVSQPAENSEEGENQEEVLVDKFSITVDMRKAILVTGLLNGKYKHYIMVPCDAETAEKVEKFPYPSIRVIHSAKDEVHTKKIDRAARLVKSYNKIQDRRVDGDPIREAFEQLTVEAIGSFLNDNPYLSGSHNYRSVKYHEHVEK